MQQIIQRPFLSAIIITISALLFPAIGMQFSSEIDWSSFDFIIAGAIIFVSSVLLLSILKNSSHYSFRIAVIVAFGATFLLVWANLAVGLIGSGPHLGNWLYILVIVVGLVGVFISKFRVEYLEMTMYAMGFTVLLIGATALILKMYEYPGSSVTEIVGVNLFFTFLFVVAGLFFRYVSNVASTTK